MMFIFVMVLGVLGMLIVLVIVGKILFYYGKEDLVKILNIFIYLGVYGYGIYMCVKVI